MRIKRIKNSLLMSMIITLFACSPSETQQEGNQIGNQSIANKTFHVAITSIVDHPALDDVRRGVEDELKESGFENGKNLQLDYQSAQGNLSIAGQIAKKFVGDNPDAIVAIATPSAQSVVAATSTIPVVFSAVTDPVAAKLIPSWNASGTNVTGMSDLLPLEPQIDLMKKIIPNLKSVGYVYSPGEVNSSIVLDELKTKLQPMGIEVKAVPAQRTVDIPDAVRSLVGKVDLIYSSLDNNVVSSYESMYKVAVENKIPLVASDTNSVSRGAIAALGINYYTLGRDTGKLVVRILKGEKVGTIKPETIQKLDLYVSPKHATEQGITLSDELIKSASKNIDQ